ncbi:hypothetical protein DMH27_08020 [Raoultella planticola]|nr:hypothetical protein [Raoultella planticola]
MRMIAMKVPENYLQQAGCSTRWGIRCAACPPGLDCRRRPCPGVAGDALGHSLQREGIAFDVARLTGKCTLETVQNLARQAQESGAQGVVGLGGGAVMDTAKGWESWPGNCR